MRITDIISRRNSNRLSLFSSYNFASVVVFDSGMPRFRRYPFLSGLSDIPSIGGGRRPACCVDPRGSSAAAGLPASSLPTKISRTVLLDWCRTFVICTRIDVESAPSGASACWTCCSIAEISCSCVWDSRIPPSALCFSADLTRARPITVETSTS